MRFIPMRFFFLMRHVLAAGRAGNLVGNPSAADI